MFGINENPNVFLVFFMSKDEIGVTLEYPYFNAMPFEQKSVRKFDYQLSFNQLIKEYEQSHDIEHLQQMFDKIVVAGVGFGAVIANEIAHRYRLRALLINPNIGDKNLPFRFTNAQPIHVLIEEDKVDLAKQQYQQIFAKIPNNWQIEFVYGDCYGVGGELSMAIADLCECGWAWVDDATCSGND